MKPAQAQLAEVAEVQLGITLRGADASRPDPNGTHHLVRIGEISEDGVLRLGEPNKIRLDESAAFRFALRRGDVLLAARGTRMTAAVFSSPVAAVAGGQFCVIRPHTESLLPGYLHWFLNLSSTQENLIAHARGSYVRSLPAGALLNLEIPLPPIPRQRAIAELHELCLYEKQLMAKLAARRALLIDRALVSSLQS